MKKSRFHLEQHYGYLVTDKRSVKNIPKQYCCRLCIMQGGDWRLWAEADGRAPETGHATLMAVEEWKRDEAGSLQRQARRRKDES
jgi:hypothetical protein